MNLEDMGSAITDDQFTIYVLNKLSSDYELKIFFWRKELEVNRICLKSMNYARK
jgi:hypothetical protein